MENIKLVRILLRRPKYLFLLLGSKGWLNWISDRQYLKLAYRIAINKKLNLDAPATFNEKLQWLKLHDRNPLYSTYVDKFAVREHIRKTIGDQHLIPLLDSYESVEEIDWDRLPDRFVLKCTHATGANIICTDKRALDLKSAKAKLGKWLKNNLYWYGREWPYNRVKPRIICEEFLSDCGRIPNDYKVLCFNGKAKLIQLHVGRYANHKQDFYDRDWNRTTISQRRTASGVAEKKPAQLEKMIRLSEQLAANLRHVRIDWFIVGERLYFGEMTFYDGSGFVPFDDENDDYLLGSWIDLEETAGFAALQSNHLVKEQS
jgi:hypothetical protein